SSSARNAGATTTVGGSYLGELTHAATATSAPATSAREYLCIGASIRRRGERSGVRRESTGRRGTHGRRCGAATNESTHHDVEHRCEKKSEECHTEHAGEHRHPHCVTHLGAGARCHHERYHTHDERERRHENGPQPDA